MSLRRSLYAGLVSLVLGTQALLPGCVFDKSGLTPPDASQYDAGFDAGDAGLPDDAGLDALVDGSLPDGNLPDGSLPDADLPDGSLPDADVDAAVCPDPTLGTPVVSPTPAKRGVNVLYAVTSVNKDACYTGALTAEASNASTGLTTYLGSQSVNSSAIFMIETTDLDNLLEAGSNTVTVTLKDAQNNVLDTSSATYTLEESAWLSDVATPTHYTYDGAIMAFEVDVNNPSSNMSWSVTSTDPTEIMQQITSSPSVSGQSGNDYVVFNSGAQISVPDVPYWTDSTGHIFRDVYLTIQGVDYDDNNFTFSRAVRLPWNRYSQPSLTVNTTSGNLCNAQSITDAVADAIMDGAFNWVPLTQNLDGSAGGSFVKNSADPELPMVLSQLQGVAADSTYMGEVSLLFNNASACISAAAASGNVNWIQIQAYDSSN